MADPQRRARRADIGFTALVLVVATVFLVQAWKLPASRFDPLGPGAFPIGICVLLILLAGAGFILTLFGKALGQAETSLIVGLDDTGTGHRRRPGLAVFVFAATVLYAAVLQFTPLGFFWATAIFVASTGIAMSRRTPRLIAIAIAVGFATSGTLTLIFGKFLGLLLP
jgi:putative tricarboxylic transport membrane protein